MSAPRAAALPNLNSSTPSDRQCKPATSRLIENLATIHSPFSRVTLLVSQQMLQLTISDFARRAVRQHLQLFQEFDNLILRLFGKGRETFTLRPSFSHVMQNRFRDRRQVATMPVRRGVTHIPEFARDELIHRDAVLNNSFVAEERVHFVADDVAFEIRISAHHGGSLSILPALKSRAGNVACQIEDNRAPHIQRSQIAGRVERVRLAEQAGLQRQCRPVAFRAPDLAEERFASPGGGSPHWIAWNHTSRNIHCGLKDRRRGDVADSQLVKDSVLVKIICRDDDSPAVFLADAETLDRLHAVMMVVGVDREDAHRVDHALLVKGLDDQIGIDALNLRSVNGAVSVRDKLTEVHALRDQRNRIISAELPGFAYGKLAQCLKIDRHLARQHLDGPGAVHPKRIAFIGELSGYRVRHRIEHLSEHEDVGDKPASPSDRRLIMAIGAGSRVRPGSAYERNVIQRITLCRRAGPGRRGPALTVERSPASREYLLADFKQVIEFDLAGFDINLI